MSWKPEYDFIIVSIACFGWRGHGDRALLITMFFLVRRMAFACLPAMQLQSILESIIQYAVGIPTLAGVASGW